MPVAADGAVPRGTALADYNRDGADVRSLFDPTAVSVVVRIDAGGAK